MENDFELASRKFLQKFCRRKQGVAQTVQQGSRTADPDWGYCWAVKGALPEPIQHVLCDCDAVSMRVITSKSEDMVPTGNHQKMDKQMDGKFATFQASSQLNACFMY